MAASPPLFGLALNRLLRFLSFRPRSRNEIQRHIETKILKAKRFRYLASAEAKELGQALLEKLTGLGFVDDGEFARWLTEQRTSGTNSKGKIFLRRELTQKGVARTIVDKALASVKDEASVESLVPLLRKMDRRLNGETFLKKKQKMLQALGRRGFGWETTLKVVEKFLKGR